MPPGGSSNRCSEPWPTSRRRSACRCTRWPRFPRCRRTTRALAEKFGRDPTDEELAAELQMPLGKLAHLRSVSVHPASLDAPLGDTEDSSSLGDVVRDDSAASPSDQLREKERRIGPWRGRPLPGRARSRDHPAPLRPRRPRGDHARGGRQEIQRDPREDPPVAADLPEADAPPDGKARGPASPEEIAANDRDRIREDVLREFAASKMPRVSRN